MRKTNGSLILVMLLFILIIGCNTTHKMMHKADESKNYTQLMTLAREQLQKNPNDDYALAMVGKVYLKKGMPDSAVYYYKKALQKSPENEDYRESLVKSRIALGDTLMQHDRIYKAKKSYQSAVDIDTTSFVALCKLGRTQRKLGQYDEAQVTYRRALQLNSYADSLQKILDFLDAAHVQSNLLMKKGIELLNNDQYKQAMETLKQAVEAKPDNKEAKYYSHLASGLYLHEKGSVGELWDAIDHFGRASVIYPERAKPHFYMAKAYAKKDDKDFENIISEYKKVVEIAPESDLAKEAKKRIKKQKSRRKLYKEFWDK